MSTLIGTGSQVPLNSEDDLLDYFQSHSKSQKEIRVGLEAEFLPIQRRTGHALPYGGAQGVEAVLSEMAARFAYQRFQENGHIIALKRDDTMITLEPGGQTELSAPPVKSIFEIERQVETFREELHVLGKVFSEAQWLAYGIQPVSGTEEVSWVPKTRYQLMADYLRSRGPLAHHMMKLTATNQVNFDYWSESHAMGNLRAAFGIAPIVSAMFANAPISSASANGFASYRLQIWRHTDPDRSGILWDFVEKGRTFRDYLNYLLNMPMIFIVRDNHWIPLKGLRFREFLKDGYQGTSAQAGDFELHLSTAFPEVRLKQYLEIRGTDGQSVELIPAVAAFWKGILYDEKTREKAWDLVAGASLSDREKLWEEIPRRGLQAKLGNRPILELAAELVSLSCSSLGRQKQAPGEKSECLFLNRIQASIIEPGKSPGETLLEKWNGEWGQDIRQLIRYLRV